MIRNIRYYSISEHEHDHIIFTGILWMKDVKSFIIDDKIIRMPDESDPFGEENWNNWDPIKKLLVWKNDLNISNEIFKSNIGDRIGIGADHFIVKDVIDYNECWELTVEKK